MTQPLLRPSTSRGLLVATVDGYSVILDQERGHYEISYNKWLVATTPTYYSALAKIAACQEELRSIAPWIEAMDATP
jgi:hypothetical protein